ncbi:uncharacterized protein CXorf58 homolog [Hemiscyllium ocellatum]|uniref:uncharacterized protein CXorf58 homolog n=1 Tax=Hemiscyllium ocellatum TaxID=170820 RepID=UPI002966AB88|nr:uncharacterized protein CXorf58 homolog [Hemiscyllium ocellatum]
MTKENDFDMIIMNPIILESKCSPRLYPSPQNDYLFQNNEEITAYDQSCESDIIDQNFAARIIQRSWCSYRNKQLFRLLKHTICAAEHCLTTNILRKLQLSDAELLKDTSLSYKIRFRFAGEEFPPILVFKIFQHVGNCKNHYISGKRIIRPATEAAAASCKIMGHRKFYDLIIEDNLQYQRTKIADETDVVTMKDYMQYISSLDETPAYLGGKDNYWRMLTLTNLPRTTIMYDIMDYVQNKTLSQRLKDELPTLFSKPTTEEIQLQHIRTISQTRSPTPSISIPPTRSSTSTKAARKTQRRSYKARRKVSKMRKIYGLDKNKEEVLNNPTHHSYAQDGSQIITSCDQDKRSPAVHLTSDEEWEHEVDELYAWTQELSLDY